MAASDKDAELEAVSSSDKEVSNGQVFNADADIAAAYANRLDGEDAYTVHEE